jgi:hypothetical protein
MDINAKLTAGKEPELNRLKLELANFNRIFGTHYELMEKCEFRAGDEYANCAQVNPQVLRLP